MLLSIENSRHLGISEEVFVITFFHLSFSMVRFYSHYQLFLTSTVFCCKKKKCSMLQENQVSKKNQELRMLVQNVRFFLATK